MRNKPRNDQECPFFIVASAPGPRAQAGFCAAKVRGSCEGAGLSAAPAPPPPPSGVGFTFSNQFVEFSFLPFETHFPHPAGFPVPLTVIRGDANTVLKGRILQKAPQKRPSAALLLTGSHPLLEAAGQPVAGLSFLCFFLHREQVLTYIH